MTQELCSKGGAESGAGELVDPAPPTDMERKMCPDCGAFVALIGRGAQARYDKHHERIPLAERRTVSPSSDDLGRAFAAFNGVDEADFLQHEIDRADAYLERHAS